MSSELPVIHYSCSIDKETASNNKEYESASTISTTEDKRSPDVNKENKSFASFKVIKLSGFTISKLADKEIYEVPDDISWTITWNNQSKNAESDVLMMDMMPYNGDSFGSNYHGSYTVKSLKLDLDTPSAYTFWYTTDESYKGKSTRDITSDDVRANWTQGNIASDGTVSCLNGKTPVAWGFIGTLNGNTSLVGHITIQTTGAKADDDYYNESSMMKAVVSGHSAYVSHNLSGYVFIDTDKDGVKDDSEKVLPGITATLYKKGDYSTPVKNLDGKICTAVTDKDGFYEFSNIRKDDYDVVFTGGDMMLYRLTPVSKNGEGWTNKATHESAKDELASSMYIDSAVDRSLETNQRDVLSRITYRIDYTQVNLGVYENPYEFAAVKKINSSGSYLKGAELEVLNADGTIARNVNGSFIMFKVDGSPNVIRLKKGSTYILHETRAPQGYMLADDIKFSIHDDGTIYTINTDGKESRIKNDPYSYKSIQIESISMVDQKIQDLPKSGSKDEMIFMLSMIIFLAGSAACILKLKHS